MSEPTEKQKDYLLKLASYKAKEILESWWHEYGSWDDLVEEGELSEEDWQYILDNTTFSVTVFWDN